MSYQEFQDVYREAGYPLGKSIQGCKKWAKTRLSLLDRFFIVGEPIIRKAAERMMNEPVTFLAAFKK